MPISTHTFPRRPNKFNSTWGKHGAFTRIEDWGIISFTGKCDCLVMWAHYADSHKGILIEFDTTGSGTAINPFFEEKIDTTDPNYREALKTEILPVKYPSTNKRFSAKPTTIEQLYSDTIESFFSKSVEWKYEEEYRMILNYNKLADGVVTPPQKYIKGMRVYVKFPGKTMYFKKIPEDTSDKLY